MEKRPDAGERSEGEEPGDLPDEMPTPSQSGKSQSIESTTVSLKTAKKKKKGSPRKGKKRHPPIVFNCLNTRYDVIKDVARSLGWKLSTNTGDQWDVFWSDLPMMTDIFSKMKNYQKLNHFPAMYQICRKNLLAKNLKRMEKKFPEGDFKFSPKTWNLPYDLKELRSYVNQKKVVSMIVKPEAGSQGRGIFITRRIDEISEERCVV